MRKKGHYYHATEQDANIRAYKYFETSAKPTTLSIFTYILLEE